MKRSVIIQLLLFVVLGLLVQGGFFYSYVSYDLMKFSNNQAEKTRTNVYNEEQYSLRDMVQMAHSVVEEYHARSQDVEALKELKAKELRIVIDGLESQIKAFIKANDYLPREDVEAGIKELVRTMRFSDGNYVWINDMHPTMIMHPIASQLDGKDLSENKDPKGKRLFMEMVKVCKANGEGMVDYMWAKPGETEAKPKVSYVRLIPELGWIIGTGAWIEDISTVLQKQALDQISKIRVSNGNYFWIHNTENMMVMHPINPKLDGTSVAGIKDTKGKSLFVEMTDVATRDGEGTVSYYWAKPGKQGAFPKLSFVKLFEPWGWVIGMGVYMDEVDAQILQEQEAFSDSIFGVMNRTLLFGSIIVLGVVAALVLFIRSTLRTPMNKLVQYADDVASGRLDASIDGKFKGEILKLKEAIHAMVQSLKAKMGEAEQKSREAAEEAERAKLATAEAEEARKKAETAKQEGMLSAANILDEIVSSISAASEELSAQAIEINQSSDNQRGRISETATAMEEMNATILEVAGSSGSAAENADSTRNHAEHGEDTVQKSVKAIEHVQQLAGELKENMGHLAQRAESIGQIMTVITDIADQTNLLALNAAIEAARAGEAGRGFAVVADEVRKLAEKTMQATKEVGDAIHAIQQAAAQNNESVDTAAEAIDQATGLVVASGEALAEIVRLSETSADQIRGIATAAEEQSAASEEITQTLEEVNSLSAQIAEGIAQSTLAQQELASQSARLKELIDKIKMENKL
ncbi:methyl-accepting chemotaxis protein [Desulfovibrio mangrovi]|uniref:methyl-accepting chemotaxis protein n=1 Tax=Desulfovibrio mangrovi TaxID=2976983 RepID=UPI002246DC61|nr:methyl-accepting chemotaxis protein [Desulfovibrio mangrovi]UZP65913.1 methyl-accepting chemotaxis protein [Desulfovibrio mangrovi]